MLEDFTTYGEVDPNDRIDVIPTNLDIVYMARDEVAHVYKDYGEGYFGSAFTHDFELRCVPIPGVQGLGEAWALSNDIHDGYFWQANNSQAASVHVMNDPGAGGPFIALWSHEMDALPIWHPNVFAFNTTYYLRVVRPGAAGALLPLNVYDHAN